MPKTHPTPTHCPVTGEPLLITRLEGPTSGVTVEGRFAPHEFAMLSGESLETVRLFLKTRGNLKEMERLLGVSYPTVRTRFDRLLRDLGYEPSHNDLSQDGASESELGQTTRTTGNPHATTQVLDALEAGDITPQEAVAKLKPQP
jgi:hypothetical protein